MDRANKRAGRVGCTRHLRPLPALVVHTDRSMTSHSVCNLFFWSICKPSRTMRAPLLVLLAAAAVAAAAAATAEPAHPAHGQLRAHERVMLQEGGEWRDQPGGCRAEGPVAARLRAPPVSPARMHAPRLRPLPATSHLHLSPLTPPAPHSLADRAVQGAPSPAGGPQGGKGQKEGGAKQGGGGGGGGKNNGPKIAASLSEWTNDTMSNDGWLTMSFVVAWFAGAVQL